MAPERLSHLQRRILTWLLVAKRPDGAMQRASRGGPMTEIVMAKNILDDVMSSLRHLYHRPFTFFLNRPQKWSFWIMVTAFGGLCFFALLFSKAPWPQPQWAWWGTLALLSALIAYGSLVVNSVASTVGSLRLVLPPERILEPVIAAFTGELALIARLDHTYEPRDLACAGPSHPCDGPASHANCLISWRPGQGCPDPGGDWGVLPHPSIIQGAAAHAF
jgi:hypothetical protein